MTNNLTIKTVTTNYNKNNEYLLVIVTYDKPQRWLSHKGRKGKIFNE